MRITNQHIEALLDELFIHMDRRDLYTLATLMDEENDEDAEIIRLRELFLYSLRDELMDDSR